MSNILKKLINLSKDLKKSSESVNIPQIASVAVISGNKLLMGKRRDNNKWTQPGGHLNPGEEPIDAAYRELYEEASIAPDNMYYMGSKNVIGHDGKNRMIHCFVCFGDYEANIDNDPDKEVVRWKWIDCSNGLPKDIMDNLHSKNNINLKFLGLQK
jgi:8-oxo-dGTP pyrophosphatase MutT (NUDIX family)